MLQSEAKLLLQAAGRRPARLGASPAAGPTGCLALVLCLIGGGGPALAQSPAATGAVHRPRLLVASNESGGRITVLTRASDSAAVEAIRMELLEAAAAIRRGDPGRAVVLGDDPPTLAALAERHGLVRATFRPLPGGGELMLLSDDADTVSVIQRALARTRNDPKLR